jgi:hypothetical protein
MNFLGLSERLNTFLYKKDLQRLTPADMSLARTWTLSLIREGHPHWDEAQVEAYYEHLAAIRVQAVDEWSRRFNPSLLD